MRKRLRNLLTPEPAVPAGEAGAVLSGGNRQSLSGFIETEKLVIWRESD